MHQMSRPWFNRPGIHPSPHGYGVDDSQESRLEHSHALREPSFSSLLQTGPHHPFVLVRELKGVMPRGAPAALACSVV